MQNVLFISATEIAFIMFVAVLLFGSDKIPEIARNLGKGMKAIRNATEEIKNEVTNNAAKNGIDQSVTKELEEVKNEIEDLTGTIKRK